MIKQIAFLTILLLASATVLAQVNLEKEILQIEDTDSSYYYIENGRRLIMQKIEKQEFDQIPTIVDYVYSQTDTERFLPFYAYEKQMLGFIANDSVLFFSATKEYGKKVQQEFPPDDKLLITCSNLIKERYDDVKPLPYHKSKSEIDLVYRIFLGVVGVYTDSYENKKQIRIFNRLHPQSEYKTFVNQIKHQFNIEYMDYHLGYGPINFNNNVGNFIDGNNQLYFDCGAFTNRFYWGMYLNPVMSPTLKNPMTLYLDDATFNLEKDKSISNLSAGFKFGWMLYTAPRIKIYPLISLGTFNTHYSSITYNDETLSIDQGFIAGAGVNTDVALIRWKPVYQTDNDEIGLRFHVGYTQIFSDQKLMRGNYTCASLGIFYRFTTPY